MLACNLQCQVTWISANEINSCCDLFIRNWMDSDRLCLPPWPSTASISPFDWVPAHTGSHSHWMRRCGGVPYNLAPEQSKPWNHDCPASPISLVPRTRWRRQGLKRVEFYSLSSLMLFFKFNRGKDTQLCQIEFCARFVSTFFLQKCNLYSKERVKIFEPVEVIWK